MGCTRQIIDGVDQGAGGSTDITGKLDLDGSNANTNIDISTYDFATAGDIDLSNDTASVLIGTGGLTGALGADAKLYSDGTSLRLSIESPSGVWSNPALEFTYHDLLGSGSFYVPVISSPDTSGIFAIDHFLYIKDPTEASDGVIIVAKKTDDNAQLGFTYESASDTGIIKTQGTSVDMQLSPTGDLLLDGDAGSVFTATGFDSYSLDSTLDMGGNKITGQGMNLTLASYSAIIDFYGTNMWNMNLSSQYAIFGESANPLNITNYGHIHLEDDTDGMTFGVGKDIEILFNGQDGVIRSNNITALDELLFQSFDLYDFDNDMSVTGTGNFEQLGTNGSTPDSNNYSVLQVASSATYSAAAVSVPTAVMIKNSHGSATSNTFSNVKLAVASSTSNSIGFLNAIQPSSSSSETDFSIQLRNSAGTYYEALYVDTSAGSADFSTLDIITSGDFQSDTYSDAGGFGSMAFSTGQWDMDPAGIKTMQTWDGVGDIIQVFSDTDFNNTDLTDIASINGVDTGTGYSYFVLWAEENNSTTANSYEWSWGNGDEAPSGGGAVVGVACELYAVGTTSTASETTLRVSVYKNTVLAGSSDAQSGLTEFTTLGSAVSFSEGDVMDFRTLASGSSGTAGARCFAYFRVPLAGLEGPAGPAGDITTNDTVANNELCRWDGALGALIQGSTVTLSDAGVMDFGDMTISDGDISVGNSQGFDISMEGNGVWSASSNSLTIGAGTELLLSGNSSGNVRVLGYDIELEGEGGNLILNASEYWTANGTNTVTISSVAPSGVGTATISKWLTVVDNGGTTYYIPAFT